MNAATISDIKKELNELQTKQLLDVCLRLAKYKKENKEFLAYLLFDAHNKSEFAIQIKNEMQVQFNEIDARNNLYFIKKSLRKILRLVNRYCKYIDDKALSAELHIYFCDQLIESGIPFKRSQVLINLYSQEIKKINSLVAALHPDLQADFNQDLERIS